VVVYQTDSEGLEVKINFKLGDELRLVRIFLLFLD